MENKKIVLIRHGMTEGNKNRKYIGITDEVLCDEGKAQLKALNYELLRSITEEDSFELFVSPLKRCRETAEIIFPDRNQQIVEELAEMNFGLFENRAFSGDLEFDSQYQAWLDTMCEGPVPGGENKEEFTNRCIDGFSKVINECSGNAVFVVHGGTIMSIMSQYGKPEKLYYEWNAGNGHGFIGDWTGEFIENIKEF